jgi:hypothetical protein
MTLKTGAAGSVTLGQLARRSLPATWTAGPGGLVTLKGSLTCTPLT